VLVARLDLAGQASVAAFAAAWDGPPDILINNAGIMASPLLDGIGGRCFEDCNEAGLNEPGSRRGVAAYALDASDAALLWQVPVDTLASAQLA
jgi:NAD(P)-dependent dehydrogenase (short-subunit alcohol dehydrogenase family)